MTEASQNLGSLSSGPGRFFASDGGWLAEEFSGMRRTRCSAVSRPYGTGANGFASEFRGPRSSDLGGHPALATM